MPQIDFFHALQSSGESIDVVPGVTPDSRHLDGDSRHLTSDSRHLNAELPSLLRPAHRKVKLVVIDENVP